MSSLLRHVAKPFDVWLSRENCRLDDLACLVEQETDPAHYRLADEVFLKVPIYAADRVRSTLGSTAMRGALMSEWIRVLDSGPGIIIVRRTIDAATVASATITFQGLIDEQRQRGQTVGDHFAKPGDNDRVWNALQKLCLRAPEVFAAYYGNEIIAAICAAWLGPGYQVTSQVNVVNPGGAAQRPHRDYHLGFQGGAAIEDYAAHVHRLSPALTLQGAIAHGPMPLASGPTMYLPNSQRYREGYLATSLPAFQKYFDAHLVQLELDTGDAVFFNPAVWHAAGANRTSDYRRMANLLQVSSPFGRAMESVDRTAMSIALYPVLRGLVASGKLTTTAVACAIAACAEGYAFPTNLDADPPIDGLAPESQQALMQRAFAEGWDATAFAAAIQAQAARRAA